MSAICFCFVPRGGNRQPCLRQSVSPNRIRVQYLFAFCFALCLWMFRDGDLSLRSRSDDLLPLRDTRLSQDFFLLLPLPQLLALPSASLLARRFRLRNLIPILLCSKVAVCALREPSSIQHYRQTMPYFSSLLPDTISIPISESLSELVIVKFYVNRRSDQHCFCCAQ